MNKQMKTLNKKKKKLNTKFSKPTSLPTRTTTKPYPTKVSNLSPTNKASYNQKYKTQFLLLNHQKLELWSMSLSIRNQTIPKFNSSVSS